jgi:hypothetical protein
MLPRAFACQRVLVHNEDFLLGVYDWYGSSSTVVISLPRRTSERLDIPFLPLRSIARDWVIWRKPLKHSWPLKVDPISTVTMPFWHRIFPEDNCGRRHFCGQRTRRSVRCFKGLRYRQAVKYPGLRRPRRVHGVRRRNGVTTRSGVKAPRRQERTWRLKWLDRPSPTDG